MSRPRLRCRALPIAHGEAGQPPGELGGSGGRLLGATNDEEWRNVSSETSDEGGETWEREGPRWAQEALGRPCDLDRVFSEAASFLPTVNDPDDIDWVSLSSSNLPQPSPILRTDRFWMRNIGWHFYGDFPVPTVSLCIDKTTCRNLGLLILAVLFHREPVTVEVKLSHPASQVKRLRVRYEHPHPDQSGLGQVPAFFTYAPEDVHRQPWVRGHTWSDPDVWDLPRIQITNSDEVFVNWVPSELDTVIGFGTAIASSRLAELLLNASLETNRMDEFQLESEPGYRGVSPASAELHIYLPGSIGYCPLD